MSSEFVLRNAGLGSVRERKQGRRRQRDAQRHTASGTAEIVNIQPRGSNLVVCNHSDEIDSTRHATAMAFTNTFALAAITHPLSRLRFTHTREGVIIFVPDGAALFYALRRVVAF